MEFGNNPEVSFRSVIFGNIQDQLVLGVRSSAKSFSSGKFARATRHLLLH